MDKVLKVINGSKKYFSGNQSIPILDNINFSVSKNEFIAIMGPSGSGKTTLLNCISLIDKFSEGQVIINGRNTAQLTEKEIALFRREEFGFVFQDFNLLNTLTLRENIMLSLSINHVDIKEINRRIVTMSDNLGITHVLDKYPYEVSGGEKQRCACVRAISNYPSLIFADEPTGALDSHSTEMLLNTLQDMHQSMYSTILMVTHDIFAASYASKVLFLRDGKIYFELNRGNMKKEVFEKQVIDVCTTMKD